MHFIILIFVILIVSGCGGPMLFSKDGATETDLKNDGYDCRQQWNSSAQGIVYRQDPLAHLYELSESGNYVQACMERKGWSRAR